MPEQRLQKTREAYRTRVWFSPAGFVETDATITNTVSPKNWVDLQTFEWSKVVKVEEDIEEPTAETPWAV